MSILTLRGGTRHGLPLAVAVITVVALALGFLTPAFGAEDTQTRIKNLKVSVWPEYDEPRVLVMYQGEFADKASFPKKVTFRLPKDAEPSQVCALSEKQEHLCQLYDTIRGEDFTEVVYTLPIPTFFLEFYYSPIQDAGARNIAFTYSNVYPSDKMDVEVQQPLRSSEFNLSPNSLSVTQDNKGFKYNLLSFDNVKAEQKMDLKIDYTKQDKNPSVPKAQQGSGGSTGTTSGAPSDFNVLVVIVVAIALAGMAYVGLSRRQRRFAPQPRYAAGSENYRGQSGHGQSRPAGERSRLAPQSAKSGGRQAGLAPRGKPAGAFCSECGNGLEPGDKFCAICGKKTKGVG